MKRIAEADWGFTLLELMISMTIIAIMATVGTQAYQGAMVAAKMNKDLRNQGEIVKVLVANSVDNAGHFLSKDEEKDAPFTTSTDAFNYLMITQDIKNEDLFFTPGSPSKAANVDRNGRLDQNENCMSYVVGLQGSDGSPIIADEMIGSGTYGATHPWLKKKKAIVGYTDGSVRAEALTSNQEGATIKVGKNITNIFQPGSRSEDGEISGGLLPSYLTPDAVLNP